MIIKNYIPQELRDLPNWINFGLGERKDDTLPTRYKKIPLHPNGKLWEGKHDSSTYTFEEVTKIYDEYNVEPAVGAGIAFVLKHDTPYIVLDLDETDMLPPLERLGHTLLIRSLKSYTYQSYSGYGYHVIIKVKEPIISTYTEGSLNLSVLTGGLYKTSKPSWVIMTGQVTASGFDIREIDFKTSILHTLGGIIDDWNLYEEDYHHTENEDD